MQEADTGRCDSCRHSVPGESLSGESIEVRYIAPGGVEQTVGWRASVCRDCREAEKFAAFLEQVRGVLIRAHKCLQGE